MNNSEDQIKNTETLQETISIDGETNENAFKCAQDSNKGDYQNEMYFKKYLQS